jgi:hypothetical protein
MELKMSQSRKVDSPRRGRVVKEEEEGLEAGGGGVPGELIKVSRLTSLRTQQLR